MDCTPFTVSFTGTPEELFTRMQQAANEQNFALSLEDGAILVKVFGFVVAKANYQISGQQVTITITQNPPGYPCEKTQHIITKFISS